MFHEINNLFHVVCYTQQKKSCLFRTFRFCFILFYLLDYVKLGRISKCSDRKKKKKLNLNLNQNCHTFMGGISVECLSIRLEVNFSLKYLLICNDYHSNGFLCQQQARQSFCSISLGFPVILSLNQYAADNVIQLIIKNKPNNSWEIMYKVNIR